MYLVDTDVVSAIRKLPVTHPVVKWLDETAPDVFPSTISLVEIERGIEKQRRIDPLFSADLEAWLKTVLETFKDRTLPMTIGIAQRWGRMQSQLGRMDFDIGIAATALEHDLTVVTRNIRHFEKTGVAIFNPFGAA